MALLPHTMVTAVCLPFLLGVVVVQANSVRHFQLTPRFSDVSFTNHVLVPFTVVRSRLGCLRNCATRAACKAITYNPGTRSCQQYSVRMEAADPSLVLPGAQTFIFPIPPIPEWINGTCATDSDCVSSIPEPELYPSAQLPVCFKQLCLCAIGCFYSVGTRLCVHSCANNQLQSSYTMHPGSGIVGHNDYTFTGDAEQCKQQCSAFSDCENFEITGSTCHGATVSGVDHNADSPSWNYYQRDCA